MWKKLVLSLMLAVCTSAFAGYANPYVDYTDLSVPPIGADYLMFPFDSTDL